jgi:hypothetical protein
LLGKGSLKEKDTGEYFKFLVLLSFEEKTGKAVEQLIINYKKRNLPSQKYLFILILKRTGTCWTSTLAIIAIGT